MRELAVEFELVTPAYAGGAERGKTDGLRPPELKSLLRFWWRAAHGDKHGEDLFDEEARIFGAAPYKKNGTQLGGQGVRVIPSRQSYATGTKTYSFRDPMPLFYMVYGADRHRGDDGQWEDDLRVEPGGRFPLRLVGPTALTAEQWADVQQAVWLFAAFGGFGRRSRRGFGSVQLAYRDHDWAGLPSLSACASSNEVAEALGSVLKSIPAAKSPSSPSHTAFSAQSRLVVGDEFRTWETALTAAGSVFYELRRLLGTEYNHTARGTPVGPDFDRTATYCKGRFGTTPQATYGALFGLPQNYQFSNSAKASYGVCDANGAEARRASSLMFKVLKLSSGKFVPIVLWLPSRFLGSGYYVQFTASHRSTALAPPRMEAATYLFASKTTALPGRVGAAVQQRQFGGYPARSGWQEVIW